MAQTFTWILDAQRPLKADDLFDPTKEWQERIDQICFDDLKNKMKKEDLDFYFSKPRELDDLATDPNRWTFTSEGLGIQFNQYEVGPRIAGTPKVIVPWAEIEPFLIENPIFSIKAL